MLLLLWPGACIYLVNEKSGVNQEFPKFLFKKNATYVQSLIDERCVSFDFFVKIYKIYFRFWF